MISNSSSAPILASTTDASPITVGCRNAEAGHQAHLGQRRADQSQDGEDLKLAHNVAWRGGEHGKIYSNVIDISLSNSKVTAARGACPAKPMASCPSLGYGRKKAVQPDEQGFQCLCGADFRRALVASAPPAP